MNNKFVLSEVSKSNLLALVLLFVGYFLTTGSGFIQSDYAKDLFRYVSLIFFLYKLLIYKEVNVDFAIFLSFLIVFIIFNQSSMLLNIIFILIVINVIGKSGARAASLMLFLPLLIIVFLNFIMLSTGLISPTTTNFFDRARSTIGFANANQASAVYMSLALVAYYLNLNFNSRLTKVLYILSLGTAFYVFSQTDTRTSNLCLILFIILNVTNYFFKKNIVYLFLLRFFSCILPSLATLVTFYLTFNFTFDLDFALSGRLSHYYEFVSNVTNLDILFGWDAKTNGGGVDNGYIMLLTGVGVFLYLLIILYLFRCAMSMAIDYIPVFIIILIYSLFEASVLRPELPLSILFFSIISQSCNEYSLRAKKLNLA